MMYDLYLPQDDAAIWAAFRHHSRTFSMATQLFPASLHMPVATLYMYCRLVDTIADEYSQSEGKAAALEALNVLATKLNAVFMGEPMSAFFWRRLVEIHQTFAFDPKPLYELIEGARWDLEGRKVETEADLLQYANLVAGCVGAMMLPFLVTSKQERGHLEPTARALGNAMQITNILRDVGEDYRNLNRVYLPTEWLARFGVQPQDLAKTTLNPHYPALMEFAMQKAERLYIEAFDGIHALPVRVRGGIRAAARLYREILNEVRLNNYNNLTKRAYVPTPRKMRLLLDNNYYNRRDRILSKSLLKTERVYPKKLNIQAT